MIIQNRVATENEKNFPDFSLTIQDKTFANLMLVMKQQKNLFPSKTFLAIIARNVMKENYLCQKGNSFENRVVQRKKNSVTFH